MGAIHSPAPWNMDLHTQIGLIRDAFGDVVAMVPLRRVENAEAQQMVDGFLLAAGPDMLRSIETTLELHAGGCIRLPDGLQREMLQLQQAARGGL